MHRIFIFFTGKWLANPMQNTLYASDLMPITEQNRPALCAICIHEDGKRAETNQNLFLSQKRSRSINSETKKLLRVSRSFQSLVCIYDNINIGFGFSHRKPMHGKFFFAFFIRMLPTGMDAF